MNCAVVGVLVELQTLYDTIQTSCHMSTSLMKKI